ncbi:MAG TPA: GNAT family N-acetyltransferase [Bradyrhizobium sp.]|nr:GNAT family N-acetyltransferase [Bradyrhizobium sp.]
MTGIGVVPLDPATQLRSATAQDDPFIAHLFKTARAEDFAGAGLPAPVLDMLLKQQFLAQTRGYALQFPGAISFIVLRRDQPVGRLILEATGRNWRLIDIALLPSWRGQGIGGDLIEAVLRAAQAGEADELRLAVLTTNLAARRLYDRLGFVETGRDDTHIAMARRFGR